jgi:hypothetical protein
MVNVHAVASVCPSSVSPIVLQPSALGVLTKLKPAPKGHDVQVSQARLR